MALTTDVSGEGGWTGAGGSVTWETGRRSGLAGAERADSAGKGTGEGGWALEAAGGGVPVTGALEAVAGSGAAVADEGVSGTEDDEGRTGCRGLALKKMSGQRMAIQRGRFQKDEGIWTRCLVLATGNVIEAPL